MRKFVLAACALALPLLSGCVTAYRGYKTQIATCEGYASLDFVKEELANRHLAPMPQLISQAVDRYRKPAASLNKPIKPIVVRFSEAGNLSSQCDALLAVSAMREVKENKIVLVFVHGWRNDTGWEADFLHNYDDKPIADVMGDDLETFANLATSVSIKSGRPVIPIFISWKGGPGLGPLDVISFWDRRDAADRIARTGELNRLFGEIENIKDDQASIKPNAVSNHVIYIGHSFGSRILFSSIVSDVISRTQLAAPEENDDEKTVHKKIKSPADMILLFNPALEAASYRAIDQFRYSKADYKNNTLPLMLVMQSESDKAVSIYFRLGQFIGGAFANATRNTGLGFKSEFRTHVMCVRTPGAAECQGAPEDRNFLCPKDYEPCPQDPYIFAAKSVGKRVSGDPEPHDSPFDIVSVSEQILDGHVWSTGRGGFGDVLKSDKQDAGKFNEWLSTLLTRVYDVRLKEEVEQKRDEREPLQQAN